MEQKSLSQMHHSIEEISQQTWLNDFPTKCLQEDQWQIITGQIGVNHFMKNPAM